MHQSSYDKMKLFREKYLSEKYSQSLKIVDLGSQDVNGTYKPLFDSPNWNYTGIDMAPGKNVDIILRNTYSWDEIKSNSVDIVISGQAFEHIEYFWLTMLEVARVLKSGGLVCIIAPSGGHEHRYPVDCWRFYPDGFASLARFSRLDVLEVFTQWDNQGYPDGSDEWKDSVLIARKPVKTMGYYLIDNIRRYLIRFSLNLK